MNRSEYISQLKLFGQEHKIPNISWTGVHLLRFLIMAYQPQRVLEMGCANGFSSIVIADALEKTGGTLVTGDISLEAVEQTKKNLCSANLQNVEVRHGNILETVHISDGFFDIIFIDAQKSHTHLFFQFAEKILAKNGIIVIDDTQKFAKKMHSFHSYFANVSDEWYWCRVPEIDDAIMVLQKK